MYMAVLILVYFLLFRLFQCAPNIKQQLWHHQAVDGGGINIQQTFCNALWFPVKWVESQVPFDNRVSKFWSSIVNCQIYHSGFSICSFCWIIWDCLNFVEKTYFFFSYTYKIGNPNFDVFCYIEKWQLFACIGSDKQAQHRKAKAKGAFRTWR